MIEVEDMPGLRRITLTRTEKANALTAEMLELLVDAVEGASGARALVLTGAGETFSAGADLDEVRDGLARSPLWEKLSSAIELFPGLSVAAINGTCAGGAMGMVLACDLRVAEPGAAFFYPVMRLGFLPQPSDPRRLARLVGPARAKLMLMAGQRIEAVEAMAWGLVDLIADDALEAAERLAADVLAADADHVTAIKRMIETG